MRARPCPSSTGTHYKRALLQPIPSERLFVALFYIDFTNGIHVKHNLPHMFVMFPVFLPFHWGNLWG